MRPATSTTVFRVQSMKVDMSSDQTWFLTVLCFCLHIPEQLAAQALPGTAPQAAAKPPDPLNRTSPQSAVFSFLNACRERDYAKAARYLDLTKIPERRRLEEGPRLAEELGQALDRNTQFDVAALSRDAGGDREDGLPANRERVGSFFLNGGKVELQLERSDLRADGPIW